MSGEEFKNRLLEMLKAADDNAQDESIVDGFVERTIEAWADDRFSVNVTVKRVLPPRAP